MINRASMAPWHRGTDRQGWGQQPVSPAGTPTAVSSTLPQGHPFPGSSLQPARTSHSEFAGASQKASDSHSGARDRIYLDYGSHLSGPSPFLSSGHACPSQSHFKASSLWLMWWAPSAPLPSCHSASPGAMEGKEVVRERGSAAHLAVSGYGPCPESQNPAPAGSASCSSAASRAEVCDGAREEQPEENDEGNPRHTQGPRPLQNTHEGS